MSAEEKRNSESREARRGPVDDWPADTPDDAEKGVWGRLSLHEFLVDFLGGLVPGVLFLAAGSLSVLPALMAIGALFTGSVRPFDPLGAAERFLGHTTGTPAAIWIGLFVLGLMLSYVLGLLFYRRDPKVPDRVSLEGLLRRLTLERANGVKERLIAEKTTTWLERRRLHVGWRAAIKAVHERVAAQLEQERADEAGPQLEQKGADKGNVSAQLKQEAKPGVAKPAPVELVALDFPFFVSWVPNAWREAAGDLLLGGSGSFAGFDGSELGPEVKNALLTKEEARGEFACGSAGECEFPYAHLSKYLRQRGHEHLFEAAKEWEQKRSKTHINRLKIRLSYVRPEKYRPVVRNEAHVRLATSTWYMAQALLRLTWLPVLSLVCTGAFAFYFDVFTLKKYAVWLCAPSVSSFLVAGIAFMGRRNCEKFVHYQRLREAFYVLELAYVASHPRGRLLPPFEVSTSTEAA